MATFSGDASGFTVRSGREICRLKHGGIMVPRIRSTLGPCITETPGSALTDHEPTHVKVELFDDRARMQNGDLLVEVSQQQDSSFLGFPPLVRFFRSTGEALFSDSFHIPWTPAAPIFTGRW